MAHWTEHLDPEAPDGAYLPWKKVEPRVGISRTTAWRLQKTGDFPRPYVMSPGRVAYREREIEAWKASRGHRAEASPPARTTPLRGPRSSPQQDGLASSDRASDAAQTSSGLRLDAEPRASRARHGLRASTSSRRRNPAAWHGEQMGFDF